MNARHIQLVKYPTCLAQVTLSFCCPQSPEEIVAMKQSAYEKEVIRFDPNLTP